MIKKQEKRQLNNAGFSLLEVLIAMVILTIVSIPLLHSFVTVAKTNAQAKIMFKATDCAENMMETFKAHDLDELMERFSKEDLNTVTVHTGVEADGTAAPKKKGLITFELNNENDYSAKLPEGYKMMVELNPYLYVHANSVNIGELNTVSAANSGVYRMKTGTDQLAYDTFETRSNNTKTGIGYVQKDAEYFKESLERVIKVSIEKQGTTLDKDGKEIPTVAVYTQILYTQPITTEKVVYSDERVYPNEDASKKEIFNNIASKIPLESVFVMYQPRYLANSIDSEKEKIIIENYDNIPVNVYVIAQETSEDLSKKVLYYNKLTGPKLIIHEDFKDTTEAYTKLFTNLCEKAPYLTDGSERGSMLCDLKFYDFNHLEARDDDAVKILNVRDLAGKQLEAEKQEDRIYKMKINIYDPTGKSVVELDGTKLR